MKKAAAGAASLIMALLIASCASNKAVNTERRRVTIPESAKETKMEAVEDGNTATISFYANATTGYSWEYSLDREGVVEEKSSDYVEDKHGKGMVGYGGRQYFVFKGAKEGKATATFSYMRPWDADSKAYSVTVYFEVDGNGNIHIAHIR